MRKGEKPRVEKNMNLYWHYFFCVKRSKEVKFLQFVLELTVSNVKPFINGKLFQGRSTKFVVFETFK